MSIRKKQSGALVVFLISTLLAFPYPLSAQHTAKLYLFWADGCIHCKKEKQYLETLTQEYKHNLKIIDFEVTKDKNNAHLMDKVGQKLKVKIKGVPFTIIGDQYFVGWQDKKTTGKEFKTEIDKCINTPCPDIVGEIMKDHTLYEGSVQQNSVPESVRIPVIGEVRTKDLSLPVLTILIAAADGFNPCAMWALLFLISMLLPMENKSRKWILGFAFIITSAIVYYIFMAAWLNLFLFIGFIFWIRLLVGFAALFAAYHYIREFITNPGGACGISEGEMRKRFSYKLRNIVEKKSLLISLTGIVALSFSVNLIEIICSAGLPAIYTGLLTASHLPPLQYYLFMALYIFIFLLDDLVIFLLAMITLRTTNFAVKYTRASQLIGGIVMLVIGILLIFKPEWLMFG